MIWINNLNHKVWLGFFIFLFVLIGCKGRLNNNDIFLPETKVVSSTENWAVVTSEYLRVRISPDASSDVSSYLREGQLVEILGRSERKELMNKSEFYWYKILCQEGRGWVHGSDLNFSILIVPNDFAFESYL